MLRVVVPLDELIDAIKTQFNRYGLLEGANERAIFLGPVAIDDGGRTIDLRMAGWIGRSLELLSAPMLDDFSAGETKQIEGDDRPCKAAQAFVFRMQHDDVVIHQHAMDRNIALRGACDFCGQCFQSGSSLGKI